jgi:hypothetical protein
MLLSKRITNCEVCLMAFSIQILPDMRNIASLSVQKIGHNTLTQRFYLNLSLAFYLNNRNTILRSNL